MIIKAKKEGILIMGIGHRVNSINNPDKKVTLISECAKQNFPTTPLLDYAGEVEQITIKKKPNLIPIVDGCIALCFVDLLDTGWTNLIILVPYFNFDYSGFFTKYEAENIISTRSLNCLFFLGCSIGFIGHFPDQRRLK